MTPRVAVVNSSSQIGGAELSLLPVIRALSDDADVVAFLPGNGPLHEEIRALGAETRLFPLGDDLERASRQYGTATGARFLAAAVLQQARVLPALRRARPDVLYCNGFRAQLGATAPAALLRVPTVWHVRDFVPDGRLGRAWSRLARRTRLVIANSTATAAQRLLRSVEVLVVPNGVDLTLFAPRTGQPADPPTVGMAGHLTPWKGHVRFLRVLAGLRQRFPELRGAIAGGDLYDTAAHGGYPAQLGRTIRTLGLAEAVDVRHVAPEDMPRWLAGLSVLVHCPDRPEPFGRALAEALAVGVPVVAAAGPGAAEVVGDAGILLPLGAEQELVEAVGSLLEDGERRAALSAAGIERARLRFDERTYATAVAAAVLGENVRTQARGERLS